jgi:hypothetical protein
MARWLLGRGATPKTCVLAMTYNRARQSPEAAERYSLVNNVLHAARLED